MSPSPPPRSQLHALRQSVEGLLDLAERCVESEVVYVVLDTARTVLEEHRRVLLQYRAELEPPAAPAAPRWEGTGAPERVVEPVDG